MVVGLLFVCIVYVMLLVCGVVVLICSVLWLYEVICYGGVFYFVYVVI